MQTDIKATRQRNIQMILLTDRQIATDCRNERADRLTGRHSFYLYSNICYVRNNRYTYNL